MLIERMQTHPEDFESSRGKFGGSYLVGLAYSARDKKAINEAHDRYIKEPNLMARVLQALLAQPEKEEMRAGPMGITGPTVNKMWFDELTDTAQTDRGRITREMYEAHIQTHRDILSRQTKAVVAEKESIAAQIYNKSFGRERIERDN